MTDTPSSSAGHPRASDLGLRAGVGAALAATALAALWFGGVWFWLLIVVLAVLMAGEWAVLAGADQRTKRLAQFAMSVPLAIMAPMAAGPGFFALGLIAGAAFFIIIVTRKPMLGAGMIYVGLPVLALLFIRTGGDYGSWGRLFAGWTLMLVWACDTGAYFAGRTIGGPKLMPSVSPAKTWAGLAGGVIAASALAVALHVQFGLPWRMVIATPFLAALAQGGDLFESWLKRRAGVKDSGALLPGHGGVMDRLDGLVPVAPIAALIVIAPRFYA